MIRSVELYGAGQDEEIMEPGSKTFSKLRACTINDNMVLDYSGSMWIVSFGGPGGIAREVGLRGYSLPPMTCINMCILFIYIIFSFKFFEVFRSDYFIKMHINENQNFIHFACLVSSDSTVYDTGLKKKNLK